ncbi:hypothetical protein [uncultured Gammaproteobacteria bacterium]|nr:hypothetical protein [uncultured Gammaproteobacteria bacterium]
MSTIKIIKNQKLVQILLHFINYKTPTILDNNPNFLISNKLS